MPPLVLLSPHGSFSISLSTTTPGAWPDNVPGTFPVQSCNIDGIPQRISWPTRAYTTVSALRYDHVCMTYITLSTLSLTALISGVSATVIFTNGIRLGSSLSPSWSTDSARSASASSILPQYFARFPDIVPCAFLNWRHALARLREIRLFRGILASSGWSLILRKSCDRHPRLRRFSKGSARLSKMVMRSVWFQVLMRMRGDS